MSATKRPDGIFRFIGTGSWAERLADAIENTCTEAGVTSLPGVAVIEGLASAMGDTEIKKLVTTQRGGRRILVRSTLPSR